MHLPALCPRSRTRLCRLPRWLTGSVLSKTQTLTYLLYTLKIPPPPPVDPDPFISPPIFGVSDPNYVDGVTHSGISPAAEKSVSTFSHVLNAQACP
ncbi:hypothetical protein BaRGS_00020155 [Batillaria attramentaria]|uniref:Uncharacterized protein n=1 Tax=Batillaria attramentaria TaxID=370345 RepID=A0ABD0KND4_9CAEN